MQEFGNNWVESLELAGLRGGESQFRVLGVLAMLCGMRDLSLKTRDQTHAICFGSLESQQLDRRRSPE